MSDRFWGHLVAILVHCDDDGNGNDDDGDDDDGGADDDDDYDDAYNHDICYCANRVEHPCL